MEVSRIENLSIRFRIRRLIIPLTIFSIAVSFAQSTEEWKQALLYQDSRVTNTEQWRAIIEQGDARVRERAMIAFASIQDSNLATLAVARLADRSSAVRIAAAFALGQIGSAKSVRALVERLDSERDGQVRLRIFEALGRLVKKDEADRFLASLHSITLRGDDEAMGIFLIRCMLRNVMPDSMYVLVERLAESKETRGASDAAYILGRMRRGEWNHHVSTAIHVLARHRSAEVRMFVGSALGWLQDSLTVMNVGMKLLRDVDWRVRVNTMNALARTRFGLTSNIAETMVRFTAKGLTNTRVAALQALAKRHNQLAATICEKLHSTCVRAITDRGESLTIRSEAASTLAAYEPNVTIATVTASLRDASPLLQSKFILALGSTGAERVVEIIREFVRAHPSPQVRTAALDCFAALRSSVSSDGKQAIIDFAIESFTQSDIAVLTQAAELLNDSALISMAKMKIVTSATNALDRLMQPTDVEPIVALSNLLRACSDREALESLRKKISMPDRVIRAAAADAMKSLGDTVSPPDASPHIEVDPKDISTVLELTKPIRIRMETTRGAIDMELDPDAAPFSVAKILRLVEQKYYDGLLFHRVVPNFVVQGGDPRGDGWGGPGWTMRSEFGLRSFDAGAIGIASAGKDTEGSQLFITHCPTPHLDGRYSCIGKVRRGMNVVDRIEVGDAIIRVRRL